MSRRRRSSVLDAIDAFNAAYDMTTRVGRDIEMSRVASAKPEEFQGYTEEQGAQLRAAAESGQYDIGMKTAEDGSFAGYSVTPKSDPSQSGTIAMQGVTDFLGQRTAGSMSEGQRDRARQMAMAGVLEKYDPQAGMKMRRELKADERDDQRWDRQSKQWAREDQDRAREDQYRTERERLLQDSPIAQFQAVTKRYEGDMAAYNEAIKAGKSLDEIGPPPEKPNVQRPGPLQTMAGYAKLIEHDYKYGKLNTDGLISFQERMGNIEKENYVKALQAAQAGGSPEQVAKAFNQAGMQIDPKHVTITKTKQANGPDLVTLNYKDENGRAASIPVIAELEAYGQAKQVYDRFYASDGNRRSNEQLQFSRNADARAGAAAARSAAEDKRAQDEKAAKADAAVSLFRERNPNATPAELEGVRRGLLESVPKNQEITSDYKPDSYGQAGTAIQKDKAGNLVVTKIDSKGSPGKPVVIPPPGTKPTQQSKREVGEEQVIQAGVNKGKRAVWDGQGWVLKP